ncbi:MAG: DNA alkylation repair protein [Bacteroidales bacterium]|jgi:3-methyladenine DNA glycosylase AlkD|nr:DNA alkylation repair protein [Bacteroidales bacterium]
MNDVLSSIRAELTASADEGTRKSGEKFFREPVKMYGVKTARVSAIGAAIFRQLNDKSKSMVFSHCTDLFRSGMIEESVIACNWSYAVRKDFTPPDFDIFGDWIEKYVSNWASCDTLCNHTVGSLVMKYPELAGGLKRWAVSENRWSRRASAVSLIIPARKGQFMTDIFSLADLLLTDRDDMVQKGYGWMLKSCSQAHQEEVFRYVMERKEKMPRTALRYAIEKMPAELKIRAMAK